MQKAFRFLVYKQSGADHCLYWKWKLLIWLTWEDDCVTGGSREAAIQEKRKMKALFDCDDLGTMREYMGSKISLNWQNGTVKVMQPVLVQSFEDKFDVKPNTNLKTPFLTRQVLRKNSKETRMDPEDTSFTGQELVNYFT